MQILGPNGFSLALLPALITRMLAIGLMLTATCWFGSATWEAQSVLFFLGGILAISMFAHAILAFSIGKVEHGPNTLAWMLFALGLIALLQAQPIFGWPSGESYSPPSVTMQRWALGYCEVPLSIAEELVTPRTAIYRDKTTTPCPLQSVPEEERRLAWSVEPMTTQAAAGNLFLAGLMVWIGGALFSRRSHFPWLLGSVVVLGLGIATLGILGALLPAFGGWLGLRENSFAVFVSKNSAGAFLNVSLAAALGFSAWTFQRVWKQSRSRSRLQFTWEEGLRGAVQSYVANLTALQIASIFALAWIATAVAVSLSRGAAISGLVAVLATIGLVVPQKNRDFAILVALLVTLMGVGLMVFFQLDDKVSDRLNRLGEIDFETQATEGRLYIWKVSWQAALYYGWLGSGLGTFHFSSLPFQKPVSSGWFYHAESIYWEVVVTLGYLGAIAVGVATASCFRSLVSIYVSRRFSDFAPMLIAGMFLLLSQSMHSAVDFAMILPGVFVPAALLMGAALGGGHESKRALQKLKWRKERGKQSQALTSEHTQPTPGAVVASVGFALGTLLALYYCTQAATPLAVAESIEEQLQLEERVAPEKRSDRNLEMLVERVSKSGVRIQECPYLLRFVAESICLDDRKREWNSRSSDSDPKLAWMETAPFLIRLANDRVDDARRETWEQTIGGRRRLDRLRKASEYYAKARAKSPLDWQALWGNIYTSLGCSPDELALYAPVVQRTSSHVPQLLTSASIFFNDALTPEDRQRIWRIALRVSSTASIGIGRLISSQVVDDEVPCDIFPDEPVSLSNLAREVFTRKKFPRTHQILCRRALDLLGSSTRLSPSMAALLSANLSSELGDSQAEMRHLSQYLQYKPEDSSSWVRLIQLHIENQQWKEGEASLRKLRQVNPAHPAISELSTRIRIRAANP